MPDRDGETKLRYERVGPQEVKIIVEKGDLRKEVIATVVPKQVRLRQEPSKAAVPLEPVRVSG